MNAVADAVLTNGPVDENTATMPVEKLIGFHQDQLAPPLAKTGCTHFGVTVPSEGTDDASKSIMYPDTVVGAQAKVKRLPGDDLKVILELATEVQIDANAAGAVCVMLSRIVTTTAESVDGLGAMPPALTLAIAVVSGSEIDPAWI